MRNFCPLVSLQPLHRRPQELVRLYERHLVNRTRRLAVVGCGISAFFAPGPFGKLGYADLGRCMIRSEVLHVRTSDVTSSLCFPVAARTPLRIPGIGTRVATYGQTHSYD